MPTNHKINISFIKNNPLASWAPENPPPGWTPVPIRAVPGDTLSFAFIDTDGNPVETSDAVLFAGPRRHCTKASPFRHSQMAVKPHAHIEVENDGRWGFAIAFTVSGETESDFYFLPDPELEVGSNISDPI